MLFDVLFVFKRYRCVFIFFDVLHQYCHVNINLIAYGSMFVQGFKTFVARLAAFLGVQLHVVWEVVRSVLGEPFLNI